MLGAQALRTKQKCEHKEKVRLQQKVKHQKTPAVGNCSRSPIPKSKTTSDPALPTNLSALSLADLERGPGAGTAKNAHHQRDGDKIAKSLVVGTGSPKQQQKSRISTVRNFFASRKAYSTNNSQSLPITASSSMEEDQELLGGEKRRGEIHRDDQKSLSPKISG